MLSSCRSSRRSSVSQQAWGQPGPRDARWDWWNHRQNPTSNRWLPRIPQRSHEDPAVRPAAMRAIILYPLNALVEDQLGRMRTALDSDNARTLAANKARRQPLLLRPVYRTHARVRRPELRKDIQAQRRTPRRCSRRRSRWQVRPQRGSFRAWTEARCGRAGTCKIIRRTSSSPTTR